MKVLFNKEKDEINNLKDSVLSAKELEELCEDIQRLIGGNDAMIYQSKSYFSENIIVNSEGVIRNHGELSKLLRFDCRTNSFRVLLDDIGRIIISVEYCNGKRYGATLKLLSARGVSYLEKRRYVNDCDSLRYVFNHYGLTRRIEM